MRNRKAVCIITILLFAFVPVAAADWPMYGSNPAHTGVGTGNPALLPTMLWNFTTPGQPVVDSPAAAYAMLYIGLSPVYTYLYAFNEANGQVIWQYKTGGGVSGAISTPAVANGVVYFGSSGGNITALDAYNGNVLWNFSPGWRVESSPTVANGILYVGTDENESGPSVNFFALNAANGDQIWNFTTHDDITTSPAVSDGIVYVYGGDLDGHLYALNATDGVQLWNYTMGFGGSPTVAGGIVYAGCCDDIFYALNASDGASLWNFTINPSGYGIMSPTSPAVSGGVVYLGPSNGDFYALNATNGGVIWSFQTQPIWNNYTDAIGGSPAVEGDVAYFAGGNGCLYTLNVTTGSQLWNFTMPRYGDNGWGPLSGPIVDNGEVFQGSFYGCLYAFGNATNPGPTPSPSPTLTPSIIPAMNPTQTPRISPTSVLTSQPTSPQDSGKLNPTATPIPEYRSLLIIASTTFVGSLYVLILRRKKRRPQDNLHRG